ncbi:hypothetical protein PVAND_002107 [Polypedilum vanderplanki]|uniref:AB hydrolase-1 domain-containing protein n=1 Tax=Polypedilum vanderplanki TaxID=319348 RepID=A0A9J6BR74_POLVA|nr:hypothetical protein PVAND_002107 [Polypedilum vanderplanki]
MSLDFIDTLRTKEEIEFEVEEIKINLPNGGYISGKWWGNKSIRPFICLHGWIDNAGSFDRLIPLLPREFSYLAIDFPGHGRSSWSPQGVLYHLLDYLYLLTFLMKEYKWEKLSIIAHSLGAKIAFIYAGIYPDKVDMIVNIEEIITLVPKFDVAMATMKESIDNFMSVDQKMFENKEPQAFTIDQMVEKICTNNLGNLTRESAPYLLKRSIKPSKKFPGKFYLSRDRRLKYMVKFHLPISTCIELVREIKFPYLSIIISNSDHPDYKAILNAMKESKNYEFFEPDSISHHVHLVEPEKIADVIGKFIIKHKTSKSHL